MLLFAFARVLFRFTAPSPALLLLLRDPPRNGKRGDTTLPLSSRDRRNPSADHPSYFHNLIGNNLILFMREKTQAMPMSE